MIYYIFGLSLFVVASLCHIDDESRPVVMTETGQVRGVRMISRSGRDYYGFHKIPFAKPPVGSLRFEMAQPADEWPGILEADEDLPNCLQLQAYDSNINKNTIGTDDCLYLSVYSPKVSENESLPVLIYIHGGGWRQELPYVENRSFSRRFMDEDVILIYFHYRLGVLGFLSLEDEVLPGNLGLKDQVKAIEWVSRNIKNFGGDPNKITLFGNSAGGASTHYHLISPLSKDLIQGGISQSGAATCLWAFSAPGVALNRAKKLAEHFGCTTATSQELLACLKTKTSLELTQAEILFLKRDFDPVVVFQPVMEKGPNAFITDSPFNYDVDKPWIIGMTSQDGAFKTASYKIHPEFMDMFKKNGIDILPEAMMFENTTSRVKEISQAIIDEYAKGDMTFKEMTDMWTDGLFTNCINPAINKSKREVYLYLLEYKAKVASLGSNSAKHNINLFELGVSHTDELFSLFDITNPTNQSHASEEDEEFSKRTVEIWVDFAKYGYPKSIPEWQSYKKENKYLSLSKENVIKANFLPDRSKFWENLHYRNLMEGAGL